VQIVIPTPALQVRAGAEPCGERIDLGEERLVSGRFRAAAGRRGEEDVEETSPLACR